MSMQFFLGVFDMRNNGSGVWHMLAGLAVVFLSFVVESIRLSKKNDG